MYGPHTAHVEALLRALADPAIRRRRLRRHLGSKHDPASSRCDHYVYVSVRAAGLLEEWDAARMSAADVAVPSQRHDAAGTALAIVASSFIDARTWAHFTDTALWAAVGLDRPGGVLAERCACGHQLGERLLAPRLAATKPSWHGDVPACTTTSLPSATAVEAAFGLVRDWSLSLEELVQFSARIGR